MTDVAIVSAVRTAIGRIGQSLKTVLPEDLAKIAIDEAIKRVGLDRSEVDEVILGQTKQSTDAPNIARVVALMSGIPEEVPSYTVMRQCGSGLQAINNAVHQIQLGISEIVIAGGVESMSNAPYYLNNARYGYQAGNAILLDSNVESQIRSQPVDLYGEFNMGITAENLASKYNISRGEQDEFALNSHNKALKAIKEGRFNAEITPVMIKRRKQEDLIFKTDEHPRETSMEKLTKLKPVFLDNGTVTAGNSSARNDGAAVLILMSARLAAKKNIKPLAIIRSQAVCGVAPEIMGIGPVAATKKVLDLAGLSIRDIDLIELNDSFAAQSLAVIKELELDTDIVNVNGGAIALGHPLGCSGARIMVTLIHEMIKRKKKYGLATICIAGGMGMSNVIETVI